MLDRWLESLPRAVLVAGGLIVGLVLIFIANPPHTACQIQLETFKSNLAPTLFLDVLPANKKKYITISSLNKAIEVCRSTNGPGGCLDFFDQLRHILKEADAIPAACTEDAADLKQLRDGLWASIGLMTEIAWGAKPPASAVEKMGWFDSEHLFVYCRTQRLLKNLYGDEAYRGFIEARLADLPGAAKLGRNEAWARSVMSSPCQR